MVKHEAIFRPLPWRNGLAFDDSLGECPTRVSLFVDGKLELGCDATHIGFVLDGTLRLESTSGMFALSAGMYFNAPGPTTLSGPGRCVVASRVEQRGLFQIGGPIEREGRLRYIDGCSDTLLVSPPVQGDACLNLLHIPAGTHQTQHTHPSLRVGVIVSGHGRCVTPEATIDLEPGLAFVIEAEGQHSFHTDDSDLLVVAYHPDSDTGPTHDDHPMVNRTIVNGVSARHIPEIRT